MECPLPTVALVRGIAPQPVSSLLASFDLVATGSDAGVQARLGAWRLAFDRCPEACSVLTILARRATGSLFVESLAYSVLQSGREFAAWLASRPQSRPSEPGDRVDVRHNGDYTELVLTRPRRRNAVDSMMREQLCDALDALLDQGLRSLGVRGEGPSFSSGGDLDEFGTLRDPSTAHFVRITRSVAARLQALGPRTAVAVHGATIGAGIELAAFAAKVVGGDDLRVRLPEVGFGLLPGSGGTISIPRRIGRQAFLDLALTGREVNAFEALELGLVDEVVPVDQLAARLRAVALGLPA